MFLVTFLIVMLVTIAVIVSGLYVYSITDDYRRWWYLGISSSFIVLGIGCVFYHFYSQDIGDISLIVGMLFLIVLTGIYVVLRAIDKWMKIHNFDLRKKRKKTNNQKGLNIWMQDLLALRKPSKN